MELKIAVQVEAEYSTSILGVMSAEAYGGDLGGGNVGWDADERMNKTLILQIPLRNGGMPPEGLVDMAMTEDSGILEGTPWRFKADPGVFREQMGSQLASSLGAIITSSAAMVDWFTGGEGYLYVEITEKLEEL